MLCITGAEALFADLGHFSIGVKKGGGCAGGLGGTRDDIGMKTKKSN